MFKFLEKIRQSGYQTKKRLLVILSIFAMGILIYVWGAYFNFIVMAPKEETNNNESFAQRIKIGGAFTFEMLKNGVQFLGDIIMTPKEYIIK